MSKHIKKYFQKYQLFLCSASSLAILTACSTTKKVPEGEFLLTKNTFQYTENRTFSNELPDYVSQKPNSKQLFLFPLGLLFYNATNPKYDEIFGDYMSYPSEMRNQKLRDSLYIKYGYPEYKGRSMWGQRLLHNFASPPVIWDEGKTIASANNLRKRLVYRGYWDASVDYTTTLDSVVKKAKVKYSITHNSPTYISEYHNRISDNNIKKIYENGLAKSWIKKGKILDQTILENEVKRITEQMENAGYYKFNASGQEVFFTADTLSSRKQVPLILEIKKDTLDTPYHRTSIGNIKVVLKNNNEEVLEKDSLRGISFEKMDNSYKTNALWRAITLQTGEMYKPSVFDRTRKNLATMNNFSFTQDIEPRQGADSIIDVRYTLTPLRKYELRLSTDLTYSQILNFGVSPSIDLTSRNIFGGAENFTGSISGIFGRVTDTKDISKKVIASEVSAQAVISFPRLLMPFPTWRVIKKKYSPTSTISLGASVQRNLGLGRVNFNAGLNYYADINEIVTHRLSLFNTQISLTKDKDRFYDFFPNDRGIRNTIFELYDPNLYQQFQNGSVSSDDFTSRILNNPNFGASLTGENLETYNSFLQSLSNKDRQTQDVIISSIIYNFTYNEMGKKDFHNPFYFNAKIETAGNLLGLFGKTRDVGTVFNAEQKTLFDVPFSQFIKLDIDAKKYFRFADNHTLAVRQFIGVGIPYGNSRTMPFVRSYFNGGSNDIRAWRVFGGLGPADSQLDQKVRSYAMENIKLTTNVEYRMPFNKMFEGAFFVDAGNIWSLDNNRFGSKFKFNKFLSQMGVGTGLGLRVNIAYVTFRIDAAYKAYDPNKPMGSRWVISKWKPLQPVLNFAFGYPF